MLRYHIFLFGSTLVMMGLGTCLAVGKDGRTEKVASPRKDPVPAITDRKGSDEGRQLPARAIDKTSSDPPLSEDEQEIRRSGDRFVRAYELADAKAIAELFAPDAEYIDEQGTVVRGRAEIEDLFASCFADRPGSTLALTIESIRMIGQGVAMEDGYTEVMYSGNQHAPVYSRYSAVQIKADGKWLIASVREQTPKEWRQHHARLQQLTWLQGDWVDEGDGSDVLFKCTPINGGSFLLRKFSIQIAGQEAMHGEQRIGWDPLIGKFRTWIFDSEGGFSEGFWYRDGNRWELKSVGVTADGQAASRTTIYTIVDENTMTWQSMDHEVGGVRLPDIGPVTIVRRGPLPNAGFTTTAR
ncbi:MAG: SgcJ/EcaC family oxidoreductase [Planctomycetes bacterium]|nr:SgcJ/EcaC family oxidoreductase [Planctomycetota bacterium]